MAPPSSIQPPVALYVHVPFCISICPYCDFVVVAGAAARGPRSSVGRYLRAIETELRLRADALDAAFGPLSAVAAGVVPAAADAPVRPPLDSLYLGGGTPSLLPASAVARLIGVVRARYDLADDGEVTLEANPGRGERGDPRAHRDAGVTRLSFGAQSLDDAELRRLGRRHRAADVGEAVREARAAAIPSLSLDLLYDVPGQTLETWRRTIDVALALEPDHLSLYGLTLDDPSAEGLTGPDGDHLPMSAGARRWRQAAGVAQDDDRAAEMYELADERLARAGFEWYEISNWARPGHRSRHNLAYWQRRPYEAVGPGAHAFDGVTRRWNAAPLGPYLDALAPVSGSQPTLPPGAGEAVAGTLATAEAAILALRTIEGSAGPNIDAATRAWIQDHTSGGVTGDLIERRAEGRLVLTRRGRLLSNEVFSLLLPEPTD